MDLKNKQDLMISLLVTGMLLISFLVVLAVYLRTQEDSNVNYKTNPTTSTYDINTKVYTDSSGNKMSMNFENALLSGAKIVNSKFIGDGC